MVSKQLEYICARAKSWHIFEGNYEDLRASCHELANPEAEYRINEIRWIMDEDAHLKMLDIERKFHNFLASAKTLVDHTRVLMNNYSETETQFYEAFEARRKEIGNSSTVKLCHDLRNYFLHQRNPINLYCYHNTLYEDENIMVQRGFVRITKESLREYSKWSKESMREIDLLEHPLDIKELADRYFKKISEFNSWVDYELSSYLERSNNLRQP